MTQSNLKDELIKQNGHAALDQEVTNLRRLVEAEQLRARRLTVWTLVVWITWILMLVLGLGVPYMQARTNAPPAAGPTTAPIEQSPTPAQLQQQQARVRHAGATAALVGVIGFLLIALFLTMPFIAIVLTIMMILARRSASLGQIRASLASIDVQLRLALAAQTAPNAQGGISSKC